METGGVAFRDFLVTVTATFRLLYVFVVIEPSQTDTSSRPPVRDAIFAAAGRCASLSPLAVPSFLYIL